MDELPGYQQFILDLIETKPDRRSIYWFYDTKGINNMAFIESIRADDSHNILYIAGRHGDVKCGIKKYLRSLNKSADTLILDVSNLTDTRWLWDDLGSVKDGVYCTFTGAGTIFFKPPHLICFASFPPNKSMLSEDRWCIVNIGEGQFSLDMKFPVE